MDKFVKRIQTRLSRKDVRVSKSQVREVYSQIVVEPDSPTDEEVLFVVEQLEAQYLAPSYESSDDLATTEENQPVQQEEPQPMTTVQAMTQPSNSSLATSQSATISQASKVDLGITQQQIQEAVEQQFGKENLETKQAILNYVAQDTFSTAQELQSALGKLRQMRLDILMKLITDHNQASGNDEDLLKSALLVATANRQKETADFFDSFESQLSQMRLTFGI